MQENKQYCILSVDDNDLIRAHLTMEIKKMGYGVLEAASGEEALQVIAQNHIDLALLDITMPGGMSGIELSGHLREKTDIPFMFLSSHEDAEIVRQATQNGAVGYLVKPIDTKQLMPSIEAGLARAEEIRQLRMENVDANGRLKYLMAKSIDRARF